jgi:hypothetical protein
VAGSVPVPKQRRHSSDQPSPPAAAQPGASAPVDPDVARFAAALQESARREAEAKRRAAEDRQRAEQAAAEAERVKDLERAKDAAAGRLRDARRSGRGVAEAEAAYKAALAAVVAAETGERPAWAPAEPEPEPEPGGQPGEPEATMPTTDGASPSQESPDGPTGAEVPPGHTPEEGR